MVGELPTDIQPEYLYYLGFVDLTTNIITESRDHLSLIDNPVVVRVVLVAHGAAGASRDGDGDFERAEVERVVTSHHGDLVYVVAARVSGVLVVRRVGEGEDARFADGEVVVVGA